MARVNRSINRRVLTFNGASLGRGGTNLSWIRIPRRDRFITSACNQKIPRGVRICAFLPVFTATPFSQPCKLNREEIVNGLLLPVNIPDGSPAHPGIGYVFGLAIQPMTVHKASSSATRFFTRISATSSARSVTMAYLRSRTTEDAARQHLRVICRSSLCDSPTPLRRFGELSDGPELARVKHRYGKAIGSVDFDRGGRLTLRRPALSHGFQLTISAASGFKTCPRVVTFTVQPGTFLYRISLTCRRDTNLTVFPRLIQKPATAPNNSLWKTL